MRTVFFDIETTSWFGHDVLGRFPRDMQLLMLPFGLAVTCEQGDKGDLWRAYMQEWVTEEHAKTMAFDRIEHGEPEIGAELWKHLCSPDVDVIVGYNILSFDFPVLMCAYMRRYGVSPCLPTARVVDIFDTIRRQTSYWPKLKSLAELNLDFSKTGNGEAAAGILELANESQDFESVRTIAHYCQRDVELTKALYEKIMNRETLWIPGRRELPIEIGIDPETLAVTIMPPAVD